MKRTIIYDDWDLHVVEPDSDKSCGACRNFENEDVDGIGACAAHLHDVTYSEYVCRMFRPKERQFYGDDDSRAE